MLILLDLNVNDAEALLRHCKEHQPNSDDFREDARVREALETLETALDNAMRSSLGNGELKEAIAPRLLDAAAELFGDQNLAIDWLSRPLRVLGQKRPIDLPVQDAIELIGRLENGYGA
ncbi:MULTISPECIES: antitoxin Xre/MbcA/ParS toxin-binding domain-containing protein [unclassified Pseudomonas]|uniref:antitoxin Xre/MbcA/ParS toxin-binding domain-containing protein n=1 Tax=unclassified Pseudomonas TaxID=196821 RepID=UPI00244AF92D|nr:MULTISPECIES: antitoxin Xre/MbcA/ParS toxin-binding domain-containing protein [unclassified Pseudomonas]MDH0302277.1 DUF2384 domain-containing protein [Pseudomonas sp. GD04091]MDH1985992.1 DUF2384 domain-containing protein [Pseudomonas sp. GD03689]